MIVGSFLVKGLRTISLFRVNAPGVHRGWLQQCKRDDLAPTHNLCTELRQKSNGNSNIVKGSNGSNSSSSKKQQRQRRQQQRRPRCLPAAVAEKRCHGCDSSVVAAMAAPICSCWSTWLYLLQADQSHSKIILPDSPLAIVAKASS